MQHFSKVSGPIPASIPQTLFHACKGCKSWRRRVAADSASLDTASAPSCPLRRCSFSPQSSLTLRGPLRFNPGFFASKANRSPVIRRPVCFVNYVPFRYEIGFLNLFFSLPKRFYSFSEAFTVVSYLLGPHRPFFIWSK